MGQILFHGRRDMANMASSPVFQRHFWDSYILRISLSVFVKKSEFPITLVLIDMLALVCLRHGLSRNRQFIY